MADVNTTICTERHHAGCHCHEERRDAEVAKMRETLTAVSRQINEEMETRRSLLAELATTRAELTEMRQQWW